MNTIIFGIATFSSKLMVFLLMPLYTRLLTPEDYGIMDIIVNTCNLLIPLIFVSIHEAVIRYALDKSVRKSDVLTVGLTTCFKGFLVFLPFSFLFKLSESLGDYTFLIYMYVVSACLRAVCSQFTRGIGYIKLYAWDGIIATFTVVIFNLIFMLGFKMGVKGYILSVILSNFISVLFLAITGKLGRFLNFGGTSAKLRRQMIRYSLPLIPTTIFWWVMNVSDRYIVNAFQGPYDTGIYSAAYKIPTIITLLSAVFTQAWQLSAVSEYENEGKEKFYSKIFGFLQAVIFPVASGIIMLVKPFTMLLVAESYYDAYNYTPVLICAVIFSCFATFYSSFYMASKNNDMSLVTTLIGAIMNIVLNFAFIPKWGPQGAAIATLISYFTVFIMRAVDTKRFVKMKIDINNMALNFIAIGLQVTASILSVKNNWLVQILLCIFVVMLNFKTLVFALISFIEMKKRKGK